LIAETVAQASSHLWPDALCG